MASIYFKVFGSCQLMKAAWNHLALHDGRKTWVFDGTDALGADWETWEMAECEWSTAVSQSEAILVVTSREVANRSPVCVSAGCCTAIGPHPRQHTKYAVIFIASRYGDPKIFTSFNKDCSGPVWHWWGLIPVQPAGHRVDLAFDVG